LGERRACLVWTPSVGESALVRDESDNQTAEQEEGSGPEPALRRVLKRGAEAGMRAGRGGGGGGEAREGGGRGVSKRGTPECAVVLGAYLIRTDPKWGRQEENVQRVMMSAEYSCLGAGAREGGV
jgi:hypothetical protein